MIRHFRLAIAAVLLLVAAGGVLWGAMERQKALRAAQKASEAEKALLSTRGLLAAERRNSGLLRARVSELEKQVARVERVTGGNARVREVVRWRTDRIPLPCPSSGSSAGVAGPPAIKPGEGSGTARTEQEPKGPKAAPTFTTSQGGADPKRVPPKNADAEHWSWPAEDWGWNRPEAQYLTIEGTEARLETQAGNLVAVGQVELWLGVDDRPHYQLLHKQDLRFTLHEVSPTVMKPSFRYAAGPLLGLTFDGSVAVGGAAELPPFRVFRRELRPFCVGLVGGGDGVVACGLLAAW